MSDSSDITNSNSSSNNWTVLPSEEPAFGNVGPGAKGSESLTNTPSLAQSETGKATEKLTGDGTAQMDVHSKQGLQEPAVESIGPEAEVTDGLTDTPVSAQEVTGAVADAVTRDSSEFAGDVRSEEGLQVCQESVPESDEGSTPPSPTLLSPSPSSLLSFSSNLEGGSSVSHEPDTFSDSYTHISASPESHIPISPDSHEEAGPQQEDTSSELAKKVSEVGKQAELPYDSELGAEQGPEGEGLRKRKAFPIGALDQPGREGDEVEEEPHLRHRETDEDGGGITLNQCIVGALLLLGVGTILFSGVFTGMDYEDVHVRELSETELQESQVVQNAEAAPQGSPEMAELLDKLAKENQQISDLQTQLQAQKEALNLALQQAEENGRESIRNGELEKENEKMKEELSSLPALQSELESLRARVNELTLLTAQKDSQEPLVSTSATPPSDQTENGTQTPTAEEVAGATGAPERKSQEGSLEEALERQKVLLEGSRKRLQGMKEEGGGKKGVREVLVQMERRLTEEVEKLGRRGGEKKRPWERVSERAEHRKEWRAEKEAKRQRNGGRDEGRDWKEKEQRNEWRIEKDWKEKRERLRELGKAWKEAEMKKEWKKEWKKGRNGGSHGGKEWKEKERKEWVGEKEWKVIRDEERAEEGGKDWKPREEEKVKGWHKNWEGKKVSGKEERKNREGKKYHKDDHQKYEENRNGKEGVGEQKEKVRKDRHWQGTPDKTPLTPSHRHHEHNEYWKRKREKLKHFYHPLVECNGIAECAKMEGLVPVQLSDFEALLAGYLSKIEAAGYGGGDEISKLVKDFFVDGVFTHDKISFRDFVEDLADILEDMVEGEGEDDDEVEDEMEEFEKDALRKFSVTGGEEGDLRGEQKRENSSVRG